MDTPDPIQSVLDIAKDIVAGPRRESYGHPRDSFQKIANLWTAYLNIDISKQDVAMMMVLLKVMRQKNKHNMDNLIDICGYAALANVLYGERNAQNSRTPRHETEDQLIQSKSEHTLGDA